MANLYVFHQGYAKDGNLWFTYFDGANWAADQFIAGGGDICMWDSPAAVSWAGGIAVFYQSAFYYTEHIPAGTQPTGNLLDTSSTDFTHWAGVLQVSNLGMSSSPSAVVYNGNLYVFHQGYGNNGELWYTSSADFTHWFDDQQVPNLGMSGSPSAVVWLGGIAVFHQGYGDNGELWYTYSPDGKTWGTTQTDAQVMGVGMSGSPSAVVYNGVLYVFYQGYGEDGQLWYSTYDGTTWSQTRIMNVTISESPSAVLWLGGISVFHQGAYQNGQLWYTYSPDGKTWGEDTPWGGAMPVQNLGMSGSPSCVVF